MTPERYQQIGRLYHEASALALEERAAYLDAACAGDAVLRKQVEALLIASDEAESFIEQPAMEVAAEMFATKQAGAMIGRAFGHYKMVSWLGAGGMGEVYLARDGKLGRQVAVKLLPAEFTRDPQRIRRFQQEARAASSLNHPNIVTIYEIGEEGEAHYIASEYIEGLTLRQRLASRAMPLPQALDIACQMASALTAAHEAGVIHRDIKPENLMLRKDGFVKVLDFGLAKLAEQPFANANRDQAIDSQESTRERVQTSAGVVLGTVSYMSPEQARGQQVDARTDIFSLGVVLYEMVAGRVPFEGATASDTIAAILEKSPLPLVRYQPEVPEQVQWMVTKALRKEREERYQSAKEMLSDLREVKQEFELKSKLERSASPEGQGTKSVIQVARASDEQASIVTANQPAIQTAETVATTTAVKRPLRWLPLALVLGFLALSAIVFWYVKIRDTASQRQADERPVIVKTAQLTYWKGLDFFPALSPDGKTIAFCSDRSGSFEIYTKQLVEGAREIPLTTDGGQNFQPTFSPDGNFIAFYSKKRGGIWQVPVTGGTAKQLTEFGSNPSFSPNGSLIAFQSEPLKIIGYMTMNARPPSTIWTIPSTGGEPRQLTQISAPLGGHGAPSWSPDGKRIVFYTNGLGGMIWSVSAEGGDLKKLSGQIHATSDAVYAPDGKSIFVTAETGWSLYKINLSEAGDPMSEPVIVFSGSGPHMSKLSIAANGKSLVYCAVSTTSNIWAMPLAPKTNIASGKPVPLTQTANTCDIAPAFSPDGKMIAYWTFATGVPNQIWTMDAEGRNQTQITTGSGAYPWWLSDGRQIVFESTRENHSGFWTVTLEGGKEKKLFEFDEDTTVARLSPDGKRIAFTSKRSGILNLWVVPIEDGEPRQLTFDKESVDHLAWSRDGKWIAFEIRRGQDTHVAIIPSDGGEPIQLTSDRGLSWVSDWSPDGEFVLFAGQRNGIWNVWSVSRSTKQQKQITNYTTFDSYVRGPAWSPLSDRIVYEYAENTGNIWLMELK
jgi:Tol biopolymer transport system component/serine/threonine protein kinase